MYLDLFKGLELKNENLSKYDMPLVRFDGQVVIPEGQISLLVNIERKEVTMEFIMDSPHCIGAILSTLHMKVKVRIEQAIAIMKGS